MKNVLTIALLLVSTLCAVSCSHNEDEGKFKEEVTSVIQKFYEFYENEDMELMREVMSQSEEMVSFGTDINEHEVGWEVWKSAHQAQWDAIDKADLTSRDLTVFIGESGDVAWFSDITDWELLFQPDTFLITDIRITGVLEKMGNAWKIVQIHTSVPQRPGE